MKNNIIKLGIISLLSLNLYANSINNFTYVVPINQPKQQKINETLKYKQYIYDLIQLNKILKQLYNSEYFKTTSEALDMDMKLENDSLYTYEYIEYLLKVLNGVDECDDSYILNNRGYINFIRDDFEDNYSYFLRQNFPLNNSLNIINNRIKKELQILSKHLKKGKDIREPLKKIYNLLLNAINICKEDAEELRQYGILKPFTKEDNDKYNIPEDLVKINSTIIDIFNFVENGSKSKYGIENYYKKELKEKENIKLIISQ